MTLTKKGLLVAGLLVSFQIILFAALVAPQWQILSDANAAEQSTHVGNALSHLMTNTMQMAADAYNGRQVTQMALDEASSCRRELDKYKGRLTAEQQQLLDQAEGGQQRIVQLTDRSQRLINDGAFYGPAQYQIKRDVKACAIFLMESTQRLIDLMVYEEGQINQAMLRQHSNRQFAEIVLLCAFIFEGALAVVAFCWFKIDIGKRIDIISQNTQRLAQQKPLLARVGGNDEIADLDRTFHRMTEVLQKTAEDRRAMADHSRDLICQLDSNRALISINAASQPVLNYPAAQLLGKRLDQLAHNNDSDKIIDYLEKNKTGLKLEPLEAMMQRQDGAPVDTLISVRWSSNQRSFFCVVHDNSKKKMIERLRREVLQMVNHDVKTPLFTVSSFLEMASENFFGSLSAPGIEAVASARAGTSQMLALVEDLLTLEKMQSGLQDLNKEEVPLKAVLQESLAAVEAETIAKKIKIERQFDELTLFADSGLFRKAMYRVMFVIVAMLPPGGSLVVKGSQVDKYCQINLMAKGEGPSEQALLSMFDQYSEADATLPYHAGSKLSLCVTRALVELHGGFVSARVEGGMYGFVISMPL